MRLTFLDDTADEPLSTVVAEVDKIAKIKAEIAELWLHGKDRRVAIGKLLIQLHDFLAKQGSGTFMKTVSGELRIPYTTAMGYMGEAKEADDPSCYEIGNNELVAAAPENSEDGNDAHATAVEAAKTAEREKREQAKREGRFSYLYRVDFCPVSTEMRDQCKARVKELGIAEAFTRFYSALFPTDLSSTQDTLAAEAQPLQIQNEEVPVATEAAEHHGCYVCGTGSGICLLHKLEGQADAAEIPNDTAVEKFRGHVVDQGGAHEAKVY